MKVRLGEIVEQIRGVSYKPIDLRNELSEDSIALLRANNIQNGTIDFSDLIYVTRNKIDNNQLLKNGDIFICTSSGSKDLVGKAAFVDKNLMMSFGAFCKVIRPKIECQKYLGYFFQSPYYKKHISSVAAGANINNIRNEHIENLEINLPNKEEQKKIVTILDKIFCLICYRRLQLKKLDELVKSRNVGEIVISKMEVAA